MAAARKMLSEDSDLLKFFDKDPAKFNACEMMKAKGALVAKVNQLLATCGSSK